MEDRFSEHQVADLDRLAMSLAGSARDTLIAELDRCRRLASALADLDECQSSLEALKVLDDRVVPDLGSPSALEMAKPAIRESLIFHMAALYRRATDFETGFDGSGPYQAHLKGLLAERDAIVRHLSGEKGLGSVAQCRQVDNFAVLLVRGNSKNPLVQEYRHVTHDAAVYLIEVVLEAALKWFRRQAVEAAKRISALLNSMSDSVILDDGHAFDLAVVDEDRPWAIEILEGSYCQLRPMSAKQKARFYQEASAAFATAAAARL